MRHYAGRNSLRTSVQYLIGFCSRLETVSYVTSNTFSAFMGPNVHDKPVKWRDPRLNRSRQIPPAAVVRGIFDRFWNFDNCQPEV